MTSCSEGAVVQRGRRMPLLTLLWVAAASTLTVLAVPPREIIPRWRRTIPYGLIYLSAGLVAGWTGLPWVWTPVAAAVYVFGALVVANALLIRFRSEQTWRVQVGRDVAIIQLVEQHTGLLPGQRRHKRWVLHAWAAWRRGHGLGRLVATAALQESPRPLWLQAGTPELREKYLEWGAVDESSGAWMTLS